MIRKLSSVYVLAHSGFVIRCCPMAESLFILEIEFLHIRGGCSLVVVFFVLMLVGTSIRTKNTTTREQPPRMCKNSISKMKSDSAIGQHLITNPECAKTYTDDNFRIIGQARSSFHLGVLESVYIKTQNPVLCKQKEFVFSLGLFK